MSEDFVEIPLTRDVVALVNAGDFGYLRQFRWCFDGQYAVRRIWRGRGKRPMQKKVYMHREIMGFPDYPVDHISQDKLDNRRSNLRIATVCENNLNRGPVPNTSSRFRGVTRNKVRSVWVAQLKHRGEYFYLGGYETEEEAALAYNAKAKEVFGEFAYVNPVAV